MAKIQKLKNATGVTWRPQGDGRFFPAIKWKSIMFKGAPREHKAFFRGERAAILNYMASEISGYLFGEAPQIWSEDTDGQVNITDNPAWNELPYLVGDPETGKMSMSDGSEIPE
jgi:hypothetical protein